MGVFSFLKTKGEEVVARQTAKNAALGFKKLAEEGVVLRDFESASQEDVDGAVLAVAAFCQTTKPTSDIKKINVMEGIAKARRKTLINYTCICIFVEYKGAAGRSSDDWIPWLKIIDDELVSAGVPKELRLGWGLNADSWVRLNFFELYRDLHFYRTKD